MRDRHESFFTVDRPGLSAVSIPYTAVDLIQGNEIRIVLRPSEVDNPAWVADPSAGGEAPLGTLPLRQGMAVVGSDGAPLGRVVGVTDTELRVSGDGDEFFLPRSAVRTVAGDRVELSLPASEVLQIAYGDVAGARERAFSARPGMDVVGSDGDRVGEVKEVADRYLLVDRSLAADLYVPYTAVDRVEGDRVVLTIPDERADQMGWERPPAGPGRLGVAQGMEVFGVQGGLVGIVRAVGERDFVVHRERMPDLRVPYDAVRDVTVNRVVLSVPDNRVDYLGWETVPEA
ncbi:MAG: DUF2171 domain-containing protein [Thermomicrobiaceae bacterium]|nr:DUF2171 domain-containing protein [Thermomicrobiaceae bacterium]